MTLWRAGMLAVCIDDRPCPIYGPVPFKKDDVFRVKEVAAGICPLSGHSGIGLIMVGWNDQMWNAVSFRPAVLDWQSEKQSKTSELDDFLKGRIPVRAV